MNLGHSNRQKTAKRSHELRQLARDHASGLSDRVLLERLQASGVADAVDIALCKKPYELPSPAIWSAKNSVNCRLLNNLKSGLTVKIRNRDDERVFTVRFTVKTIRLEAIDLTCPALKADNSSLKSWCIRGLSFHRIKVRVEVHYSANPFASRQALPAGFDWWR